MPIAVFEDNITKLHEAHQACARPLKDIGSVAEEAHELRTAAQAMSSPQPSSRASPRGLQPEAPPAGNEINGSVPTVVSTGSGVSISDRKLSRKSSGSTMSALSVGAKDALNLMKTVLGYERIDVYSVRAWLDRQLEYGRYELEERGRKDEGVDDDKMVRTFEPENEAIATLVPQKLIEAYDLDARGHLIEEEFLLMVADLDEYYMPDDREGFNAVILSMAERISAISETIASLEETSIGCEYAEKQREVQLNSVVSDPLGRAPNEVKVSSLKRTRNFLKSYTSRSSWQSTWSAPKSLMVIPNIDDDLFEEESSSAPGSACPAVAPARNPIATFRSSSNLRRAMFNVREAKAAPTEYDPIDPSSYLPTK